MANWDVLSGNNEKPRFELPPCHEIPPHVFKLQPGSKWFHTLYPEGRVQLSGGFIQIHRETDDGKAYVGSFLPQTSFVEVYFPKESVENPSPEDIQALRAKQVISSTVRIAEDGSWSNDTQAIVEARQRYVGKLALIPRSNGSRTRATVEEIYENGLAKVVWTESEKELEKEVDIALLKPVEDV